MSRSHEAAAVASGYGWRTLTPVFKVAVSGGLLALLLSRTDVERLWLHVRGASLLWLAIALGLYLAMILGSAWRWGLLLSAQQVRVRARGLVSSFLVATFFNNFLPSNIGGDVIRVRDTADAARSRTLATTVVLMDRAIGLLGLGLVAALGATAIGGVSGSAALPLPAPWLWLGLALAMGLSAPAVLAPAGIGKMLQPLRVLHPEWVDRRIERITGALSRFKKRPASLLSCFIGAVVVQLILVAFYAAVARSMQIPISLAHLAVLVPLSFVVQMVPVSVNGFGVREATFSFYFARLGLPLESALVLSFVGAGVIMLFSLSGAAVYVVRGA
ncbi:MAG: flippase-like domain-containing protein [Acidobacteria bacterium]|nr:flippase-like domain-containing protein [Acidobacteriota bacterium]